MLHLNAGRQMTYWQRFISILSIVVFSTSASANLINADFASGFAGWHAEVTAYDVASDSDQIASGNIFASYTDNFQLHGNQVTLNTSADAVADYWSVIMYQDFMLAPINAGQSIWLSLDVSASLSNAIDDFFFVQLRDLDSNNVLDLSAGSLFDISAWSGLNLSFEFGVQDGDFVVEDRLTISNIQISTESVDVSTPPMLGLFFLSGLFLAVKTRRR